MKNKENENQERSENKDLECGETRGFSILNRNYPPFLAYDLTPNLPEEPSPKKKTDKEKPLRDKQMGGSKYLRGGGVAQRGLGRAFMKGGKVR